MQFDAVEKDIRLEFEEYLTAFASKWNFVAPLSESMRYALFSGGKRFRPLLLLKACELFCGNITEEAFLLATAVECLHTYSLVHDDLPCMDDDDFRRGKPTVHVKYGENIAVLAGDALLNMAFELVLKAAMISDKALLAGRLFSVRTGAEGLIGGQVADLAFGEPEAGRDKIEFIFAHKTCDLITAAVECGAIVGGASEREVECMRRFAYNFGFAFQIADDLLDGEDCDGCTILKVMPKTEAEVLLNEYTQKALDALAEIEKDTAFFEFFTKKAAKRKY